MVIGEWQKRSEIKGDVVYFPYVFAIAQRQAPEVYIWDLDKTYLDTKFETVKGLLKTIVEKSFQKKNVPGTGVLVRELKRNWHKKHGLGEFPIFFITASPPQMERKIKEKLHLDGIEPFGIFCKDNLQNLRPKRLWRLTQQIGYKLQALLQMRIHLAEDVKQICWGDDSEADAVIYSLYSDICSRRLNEDQIRQILKGMHVVGQQTETILQLQSKIAVNDPVAKIYINLAEDTDAEYYNKFGKRTLPIYNTFQTVLDLFQDQRLDLDSVLTLAQDLMTNFGFSAEELEKAMDDLIRRQYLAQESFVKLVPALKEKGFIPDHYEPSISPKPVKLKRGEQVIELEGAFDPWIPQGIDYLHDYR